jgi:hypothetical protein
MADLATLERALRKADAAGDISAARMLAQAIREASPEPESRGFGGMAGDMMAGAVRGAGSIGATVLAPIDAAARKLGLSNDFIGRTDRRAMMDQALAGLGADTDSFAFGAGKLGAEIAGTMGAGGVLARGASLLPGATRAAPLIESIGSAGFKAGGLTGAGALGTRAAGGAVTGGAAAGLVNPEDAGTGALIGGALPGATKAAGYLGSKVGGALRPSVADPDLARKAIIDYGIPLGPSDITKSGLTKAARSLLDDTFLVGRIGAKRKENIQGAFNKAVGKTFGADEVSLTPKVIDNAKKRMGAEFDRIWNGNALQYDGDLFQNIQSLRANASKLPDAEASRVMSWIDDLERRAIPGQNGELFIPGDVANRFQSKLRVESEKATGFLKDDLSTLRKSIIDAFNRSVSPEDAAALTANRKQYKAFKTVEPLLQGAEAGVAGRSVGDVPAGLLPQAVRQSYKGGIAGSPFEDLSQIGSQFVADRVARTGGSNRALLQNSAVGAAIGTGAFSNPVAAGAVLPVAAGVESLLSSPAIARAMLPNAKPSAVQRLIEQLELERLLYQAAPVVGASR